jgi:hypothetical protein
MTTVYMGVCMGNCYSHRKVLFTQESVIYTGKCNLHRKLVIYTGNWSFTQESVIFTGSVIYTGKCYFHRKESFAQERIVYHEIPLKHDYGRRRDRGEHVAGCGIEPQV